MFVEFLANLFFQVVLLLAVIHAESLPETKHMPANNTNFQYYSTENAEIDNIHHKESNDIKLNNTSPYNRSSRQVPNLFQSNKQPGFSTSFLNRLNTHGIAITGNIGIGVRYASGNSYNGDGTQAHQNHRENTNNVYDRYLGTTFNIGSNVHFMNKENDHASYHNNNVHNGSGNQKEDDSLKRLTSDNTTSRNTLWKRLNQYFSKSKSTDMLNGTIIDCNETEDSENCTEVISTTGNALTRFLSKYFSKNEPRKFNENVTLPEEYTFALQKSYQDIDIDHNNTNIFDKINKYFNRYKLPTVVEQIWNDRNNILPKTNNSLSIINDYNAFRSTVRDYLVERISSYVSQNSTTENFAQKFVKKALSQTLKDFQTQETKEHSANERNTLLQYLSEYFNNERFTKVFPDIESIRNYFTPSQWSNYEGSYASGWLKNNFPYMLNKYFSRKL